jgi:hypothetical protein
MKVICSNHGGKECHECPHNKLHEPKGGHAFLKQSCDTRKSYCTAAIDDLSGEYVQCYP